MKKLLENKKYRIILAFLALFLVFLGLFLYHKFTSNFKVKKFDEKIEVEYGTEFDIPKVIVCYGSNFYCKNIDVQVQGNIDTTKTGGQELVYACEYNKKKMILKQQVTVYDKEPPVITIESFSGKVCPNGKIIANSLKYKVIDNADGDISDKAKVSVEDDNLIIEATDNSNNKKVEKTQTKKEDSEAPVITMKGSNSVTVLEGNAYKDAGATATDNCDDIEIKTTNNVNTNKAGTYEVVYTATDKSGNTSTKKRKVVVQKYEKVVVTDKNATGKKVIYLTFDDGPSQYTGKLLDILKKYNVKVTFFVTGFGSDALILREYKEGHTVALHSYTHNYATVYKSVENYYADLYKVRDRVKRITGQESNLIRFPGGSSNTVSRRYDGGIKIMSYLVKDTQAKGFHYFDWNISSGDAGSTTSSDTVYRNVVRNLKKDESIVLQHDSKGYSVDAVERIIKFGLANGYTFKALDENCFGAHHGLNN